MKLGKVSKQKAKQFILDCCPVTIHFLYLHIRTCHYWVFTEFHPQPRALNIFINDLDTGLEGTLGKVTENTNVGGSVDSRRQGGPAERAQPATGVGTGMGNHQP